MSDLNGYMKRLSLNRQSQKESLSQRHEDSVNFEVTNDSQIFNDSNIGANEDAKNEDTYEIDQNQITSFENEISKKEKKTSLQELNEINFSQNTQNNTNVDGVKDSLCTSKFQKSQVSRNEYIDREADSQYMISHNFRKQTKVEYYFSLYINIKSFYKRITKNMRIQEKLTKFQHSLISDQASVFNNKEIQMQDVKNQFCVLVSNKMHHLLDIVNLQLNKIPVFTPYHILKRLWDSLIAFLILMTIYLLSIAFFFDLDTQNYKTLFRTCFIVFNIDICVTFNTGIFKNNGDVHFKRREIAKQYLHKEFLADQISLLPLLFFCFDQYETSQISSVFYLLILLKWVQLKNIFSRLNFYLSYQRNKKNLLDLIKLIFFIVCVCHIFSLFWHGLAIYQIRNGRTDTWLNKMDLLEANTFQRYLYSFYFLSTTMISVGYGDISPQNSLEVVFTILTMFTTGVVYAFSLNTIGGIIDNIDSREKIYKQNMQTIHKLMREEKVDQQLRIKISNYIDYQYQVIHNSFYYQIINDLSTFYIRFSQILFLINQNRYSLIKEQKIRIQNIQYQLDINPSDFYLKLFTIDNLIFQKFDIKNFQQQFQFILNQLNLILLKKKN